MVADACVVRQACLAGTGNPGETNLASHGIVGHSIEVCTFLIGRCLFPCSWEGLLLSPVVAAVAITAAIIPIAAIISTVPVISTVVITATPARRGRRVYLVPVLLVACVKDLV